MKTTFTLAVTGAIGSGKTTLARRLAQAYGAELLSSDEIRASLPGRRQRRGDRVFEALRVRFEQALAQGRPVVLDSTGMSPRMRGLLHAHRARLYHIHLTLRSVERFEEREAARSDRDAVPRAAFLRSRRVTFPDPPDLVIPTDELGAEQTFRLALRAITLA